MKSPLSILSPKWSGFFILFVIGSAALGISLGGSGAAATLVALGRTVLDAKGLPEENDGERLVRSRNASDQLNPSPDVWSVSLEQDNYSNQTRKL